jgi:mono/diheme cytochrome c family protein
MPRTHFLLLFAAYTVLSVTDVARADLTGPYSGQVVGNRGSVDAAAALTQSARTLRGTLVLGGTDPTIAGAYIVNGTGGGRNLRLAGVNPSGARLLWRATVTSTGATGRIKVRGPGSRLTGKLTVVRQASGGNAASCDSVFTQSQTFFTTQVMDPVLAAVCATCHVPGGQAQATRLQVVRGDPLATARSADLLVDTTNPGASLLVAKPTAVVPHGGGQQLMPGSPQAQALAQWADLVAQAGCVMPGGPAVANTFSRDCASCHGTDGAGGPTAPDVRCVVPSLLADAVRRGRGRVMPALMLSSTDLTDIATYLKGLCSHQPREVYAANCANCHRRRGPQRRRRLRPEHPLHGRIRRGRAGWRRRDAGVPLARRAAGAPCELRAQLL